MRWLAINFSAKARQRLVKAAEAEGLRAHAFVVCLLDSGLRLGEARALSWGAITWGEDEDDRSRSLYIDQNLPSHVDEVEETKSGGARTVRMSRRLRRILEAWYRDRMKPGPSTLVFKGLDPDNFRAREWRRICEAAKVGQRKLKDLRDTYGSVLFTAGAPMPYVSRALGHATTGITEQREWQRRWHCGARYCQANRRGTAQPVRSPCCCRRRCACAVTFGC